MQSVVVGTVAGAVPAGLVPVTLPTSPAHTSTFHSVGEDCCRQRRHAGKHCRPSQGYDLSLGTYVTMLVFYNTGMLQHWYVTIDRQIDRQTDT